VNTVRTFVARQAAFVKRQIWQLVLRWPFGKAEQATHARSTHSQLSSQSPDDLAPHIEAYLFLSAADLMEEYGRYRKAESDDYDFKPATDTLAAKCRSRAVAHRRKIAFTKSLLDRNVDPATAAAVLLALRGQFSPTEIAKQLSVSRAEARELLIEGICRYTFGSGRRSH
jgi:hypothetical protein